METQNIKVGDQVEFILDGNPLHKGLGTVVSIGKRLEVKIDKTLKEYGVGLTIYVDFEELI